MHQTFDQRRTALLAVEWARRAGILVHPYMLGPNGQSNGCMSLKDYSKFLAAFKRGEVERIVVVSKLDRPPAFAKAEEPENKFASLWRLFGAQ